MPSRNPGSSWRRSGRALGAVPASGMLAAALAEGLAAGRRDDVLREFEVSRHRYPRTWLTRHCRSGTGMCTWIDGVTMRSPCSGR